MCLNNFPEQQGQFIGQKRKDTEIAEALMK
jgi:hypothetical protein